MKIALILAALAGVCFSQTPTFEVASVKLTDPAAFDPPVRTSPDTLTIHGMSLRNCIQLAWQLPSPQVSGPSWLADVRLDIVAKASVPVEEKQLYVMLQDLLRKRLGVMARLEKQEIPVYALTVAKGGPKFSESKIDAPPVPRNNHGVPVVEHISMGEFAGMLSKEIGSRPFIDDTGLKGRYDLRLDIRPYAPQPGAVATPPSPEDRVSILIAALQGELGLKLESRKEMLDVLMVDNAEHTPSEN
jgi:uncharacterized protein (TIGR03435 family)